MADLQVTCVRKTTNADPHAGISQLGGPANGGWKKSRQEVIDLINMNFASFYTNVGGRRAVVAVVKGEIEDTVRAQVNKQWNDDLLALPPCR
jgi:hypothetical protein